MAKGLIAGECDESGAKNRHRIENFLSSSFAANRLQAELPIVAQLTPNRSATSNKKVNERSQFGADHITTVKKWAS